MPFSEAERRERNRLKCQKRYQAKGPRTEAERAAARAYYAATKAQRQSPKGKARLSAAAERNRANRAWRAAKRKLALTEYIAKIKDNPCMDCGQKFPPYVMDFDHRRGQKVAAIGTMLGHATKVATILAEIAKCDLVCSNCHRIRTHDDYFQNAYPQKYKGQTATITIEGFEVDGTFKSHPL